MDNIEHRRGIELPGGVLSRTGIEHEVSCFAECLDCGHTATYSPNLLTCPACQSQWLQACYDYRLLASRLPELVAARPFDLWRYRELLPVYEFQPNLSMGEGGTPLIHAVNLGMMLGCPNIFIKDERQGPTASFKDRQAAVNIAAIKEAGITEIVLASTGNVAIAYSAYAARAGIKLWAFLTSLVPSEKMREVALYGTQVVKVTASYDQTKKIAAEYARQRGLYFERGARSIPSVEAMKTIAFEICEQLGAASRTLTDDPHLQSAESPRRWVAPDWYFQAISGGLGPLGSLKGFTELYNMDLIQRIPALVGIQTEGCAPMVHAWKNNKDQADAVTSPRTLIATLSTGDPGRTYILLRQRMLAAQAAGQGGGGCFESVTDDEAFRAIHILAKLEGLSVEPATAVAFAGLIKLARQGMFKPTDTIVVNCTGHTMAIETHILGEGWVRNVALPAANSISAESGAGSEATLAEGMAGGTPSTLPARPSSADAEQEGLLAALSRVTPDRFQRILIADDTEQARRLIRRIFQSQGNYTILEAIDGRQAVEMATNEKIDLIVLDLMMPEIDGFAVLDTLKADPQTALIPVIVVTAKELTPEEKQRLQGRISTLMQKGEFMSDDLLDEVRGLLKG
jgi:threonine synthase